MRILHICFESIFSPMGGLGVFVRDVATEQAKEHDVTILGYDPATLEFCDKDYKGIRVINCRSTNIHQEPRGAFHLLVLYDMMTENLLFHLKNEKFDIIHLHDTLLWGIAKYASILFKIPIITHCHLSHALVHREYPMLEQKKFEVTQEAHAYMMSSDIFTCSEFYAKELKEYLLLDRDFNIALNGVNFNELQKYVNTKRMNKKMKVGFVGRMVPSKGVEHVLEATKAFPDKEFIIISHVAPTVEDHLFLVKEIKKIVEEQDNVVWYRDLPTNAPEKWEIMASCDVGIVPSLHEPWAIVTDEWGALKVPKIVTKIGGMVEHNNNEDSVMIEPTANSLIDSLRQFSPEKEKIEKAYENAQKISWAQTAKDVMEVYENVLQ